MNTAFALLDWGGERGRGLAHLWRRKRYRRTPPNDLSFWQLAGDGSPACLRRRDPIAATRRSSRAYDRCNDFGQSRRITPPHFRAASRVGAMTLPRHAREAVQWLREAAATGLPCLLRLHRPGTPTPDPRDPLRSDPKVSELHARSFAEIVPTVAANPSFPTASSALPPLQLRGRGSASEASRALGLEQRRSDRVGHGPAIPLIPAALSPAERGDDSGAFQDRASLHCFPCLVFRDLELISADVSRGRLAGFVLPPWIGSIVVEPESCVLRRETDGWHSSCAPSLPRESRQSILEESS